MHCHRNRSRVTGCSNRDAADSIAMPAPSACPAALLMKIPLPKFC